MRVPTVAGIVIMLALGGVDAACQDDAPGGQPTCQELGAWFDAFEEAHNRCAQDADCKAINTVRVWGRNCRLLVHADTDEAPVDARNEAAARVCAYLCVPVSCPCLAPQTLRCEAGRCVERW